MSTYQGAGELEAIHPDPIWRDRADFLIAASIDGDDKMTRWEQLWARKIEGNHFEICCIPFFVYDLALGDEVQTDKDYVISSVSKRSGRSSLRVWFGNSENPEDRDNIMSFIQNKRLAYEWSSDNLLAIDLLDIEQSQGLEKFLRDIQFNSSLLFEYGYRH
ncbi:MAG: DUF4265 domain-containing protein [Erythrobacter sp.]